MYRNSRAGRRGGPGARRGFTLIEVLVALAIGTMAIVGARSVFVSLLDHTDRINDAAREQDRAANGERMLRALVGQLDLGATGEATFSGDEREAHFTSWCSTPDGWQERCGVRLVVHVPDSGVATSGIVAELAAGEVVPLLEIGPDATIAYLLDAAAGGRWVKRWGVGITVPVAIGIMNGRDTIILRIGERG